MLRAIQSPTVPIGVTLPTETLISPRSAMSPLLNDIGTDIDPDTPLADVITLECTHLMSLHCHHS